MSRNQLIQYFFHIGMTHRDIVFGLAQFGYILSERHLRRLLRSGNLYRRKQYTDIEDVVLFIQRELSSSGKLHGYRWMWHKLHAYGIKVRKEDVRLILSCLDPRGVSLRLARRIHRRSYHASGPHYVWHIDGYDKIKRFGFAIHGCIDGFSRHLVWLKVYTTNNDPRIIAGYFWGAIQKYSGCPRIVRGDAGTENVHVQFLQEQLMGNGRNGHDKAYIQGQSTSNQRIEVFWGHLRKQCSEFWICLFSDLEENGQFLGDFLDVNIAQFCFLAVIQDELDAVSKVWNSHIIRSTRRGLPSGRPTIMFEVPFLYGTRSFLNNITQPELNACQALCTFRSTIPCDADMYSLCCQMLHQNRLAYPNTPSEALHVYVTLRQTIRNILQV